MNTTEDLDKIKHTIAETAAEKYIELIQKTQQHGSDIFGFGKHVRAKYPGYWNEHIKDSRGWEEMYKEIPIEVELTIDIRRIGMKSR